MKTQGSGDENDRVTMIRGLRGIKKCRDEDFWKKRKKRKCPRRRTRRLHDVLGPCEKTSGRSENDPKQCNKDDEPGKRLQRTVNNHQWVCVVWWRGQSESLDRKDIRQCVSRRPDRKGKKRVIKGMSEGSGGNFHQGLREVSFLALRMKNGQSRRSVACTDSGSGDMQIMLTEAVGSLWCVRDVRVIQKACQTSANEGQSFPFNLHFGFFFAFIFVFLEYFLFLKTCFFLSAFLPLYLLTFFHHLPFVSKKHRLSHFTFFNKKHGF